MNEQQGLVQACAIRHDGALGLILTVRRGVEGSADAAYREWAQSYFRIKSEEYSKLADVFNPIFFNAEEWVMLVVDSGMQYLVVTSKHHDGFAMYHSKVDAFNIVDATPYKRDVMAELAEACYKHGVKL